LGISAKDRQYMSQALELAARARGYTSPNPMVGCVIVRDEKVVGQGYHRQAGLPHAEIEALEQAGDLARGGTLYVNLEPCCHQGRTGPCTQAIIGAGISRVVAAMVDPNPQVAGRGLHTLRKAGIDVDCGVMEGEARRLNEAFVIYQLLGRPFTIAKWAMTLDGRTSTDTGDSRWISCDASRTYAHELRASVDAIAVGSGTVFLDNPRLNVRLQGYDRKQPARVIFDEQLRTPLGAKCLDSSGGPAFLIVTERASEERIKTMRKAGHTVLVVPGNGGPASMEIALQMLAQNGIQSLFVEGGRQLHTSMLRAGVIDKMVVFMCPTIIGGQGLTGPVLDLGIETMKGAVQLKNVRIHTFGSDVCMEGYINLPPPIGVQEF
jgi:diaminohydroxyphosphoribosylaminopyrimidine deaminase/5-amino-6-(5-phosphoribosylamino)uracil reductase